MKPTTVMLLIFCCVAHLCGMAQSGKRYKAKTLSETWAYTWGRSDKDIAAAKKIEAELWQKWMDTSLSWKGEFLNEEVGDRWMKDRQNQIFNEPLAYIKPITTSDSCYEYVDSISVEYGFRSTNVRYKLLVRDAVTREKFVMTLYSDYNNLPGPAPVPKGFFCLYRGIITVNKRAYTVASIK